ncbi:hypothetical protein D9M70_348670 [compost metagenome]
MATLQPGPQAGHQLRVHMEQRQAAEVAFAGGVATEHGAERPGVEDLGALGAHGDLRQAGGAAGAEVGGMVRGADGSSAGEAVVRLSGEQLVQVMDAALREALPFLVCACTRRMAAPGIQIGRAADPDQLADGGQPLQLRSDPFPGVLARGRRQGHQHAGIGRAQQLGDLRAVEQGVDRHDDAGRFAAPGAEMGFRQVGQHEGHDVARTHPQGVEGVGCAGDRGEQLGIAPVPGLLVVFGIEEEAQRGSLRAPPGAALQGGVGALRQVVAGERSTFEVHDIGKGTEA